MPTYSQLLLYFPSVFLFVFHLNNQLQKHNKCQQFELERKTLILTTTLQFGLVHHFTKLGSGEYYLEELEHEVIVGML